MSIQNHPIFTHSVEKKEIKKFSTTNREFGGEITITIEIAENENGYYRNAEKTSDAIKSGFGVLLEFIENCLGCNASKNTTNNSTKCADSTQNQNPNIESV